MKVGDRVQFYLDKMIGTITKTSTATPVLLYYVIWDDGDECWCLESEIKVVK